MSQSGGSVPASPMLAPAAPVAGMQGGAPEFQMQQPGAPPPSVPPASGGKRGGEQEMGKVFVGGLARETTTAGLKDYFERFGEISDCVVMKDRTTGLPRGFGFVTYASQVIADRVVLHRHVIDDKEVEAKPAVPRGDGEGGGGGGGGGPRGGGGPPGGLGGGPGGNPGMGPGGPPMMGPPPGGFGMMGPGPGGPPPGMMGPPPGAHGHPDPHFMVTKKIFVGGLAHETSEVDFTSYFGQFGTVVDCVIMCDPHTRKPRGFGFITCGGNRSQEGAGTQQPRLPNFALSPPPPRTHAPFGAGEPCPAAARGPAPASPRHTRLPPHAPGSLAHSPLLPPSPASHDSPPLATRRRYDAPDAVERVVLSKYHDLNGKRIEVEQHGQSGRLRGP